MNTRNFLKSLAATLMLGALAITTHAENFNPGLIGMRVVSKVKKSGTQNIYYYVLEAQVNTQHNSVESKLGGVGAVPTKVATSTYRVQYQSNPGKTWQFKAKLNGVRVAERNAVIY